MNFMKSHVSEKMPMTDAFWVGPQVVRVEEFCIDQYEVTNRQYLRFIEATHCAPPSTWTGGSPAPGTLDHPVTGVSQVDAEAYAHSLGNELPTVAQWMRAFHGAQPTLFPWGDDWEPDRAHTGENTHLGDPIWPVTETPRDVSSFGVFNLVGNVSELTRDTFLLGDGENAIVKGSSGDQVGRVTGIGAHRGFLILNKGARNVGFRCVYEPKKPR
jgi:formylglycine-generating enzyme required for sulfatase activity